MAAVTSCEYDPEADLRTFALIVYAHPYCARNSCRKATPRHRLKG